MTVGLDFLPGTVVRTSAVFGLDVRSDSIIVAFLVGFLGIASEIRNLDNLNAETFSHEIGKLLSPRA